MRSLWGLLRRRSLRERYFFFFLVYLDLPSFFYFRFVQSEKRTQVLPHMPPERRKFVHDVSFLLWSGGLEHDPDGNETARECVPHGYTNGRPRTVQKVPLLLYFTQSLINIIIPI